MSVGMCLCLESLGGDSCKRKAHFNGPIVVINTLPMQTVLQKISCAQIGAHVMPGNLNSPWKVQKVLEAWEHLQITSLF